MSTILTSPIPVSVSDTRGRIVLHAPQELN